MATASAMLERRRASRVRARVPVTILRDGAPMPALAVGVSRCGALVRVPFAPPIGSRLQLVNDDSQEKRECRVVRIRELKQDGSFELGLEILYPSRNFWGLSFPDDFGYQEDGVAVGVEEHQFPRS